MKKLYLVFKGGLVNGFLRWSDAAGLRKQKQEIVDAADKLMNLATVLKPMTDR
jgi:hypothetical protein